MFRYHITIEYDGTPFVGWQRQVNGPSVQQSVEEAGAALSGAPAVVAAAGRTDTGVHALAMSAHIDLVREYKEEAVIGGLNAHMSTKSVCILSAKKVSDAFHARFSCTRRQYLYRMIERRSPLVLEAHRLWRVPYALDVEKMAAAAKALQGHHDFTTFRSAHCQSASPVKTIDEVRVFRQGAEIHITCAARSFMHNQVRSFVGTLERVGVGRWAVEDVAAALAAKDRAACGPVAPAQGLYFLKATY